MRVPSEYHSRGARAGLPGDVRVLRRSPVSVEGVFAGTMNASDGTTLRIGEGFASHE